MNERTHRLGAPGSIARYLDDLAHNPDAPPFPHRYVVFGYAKSPAPQDVPMVFASSDDEAELRRWLSHNRRCNGVLVDLARYRCAYRSAIPGQVTHATSDHAARIAEVFRTPGPQGSSVVIERIADALGLSVASLLGFENLAPDHAADVISRLDAGDKAIAEMRKNTNAPTQVEEAGWLIELIGGGSPAWLGEWRRAQIWAGAKYAIRFARKVDAEAAARILGLSPQTYRVTNHLFLS